MRGVLERVRTWEKVPVQGLEALAPLVGQMLGAGKGDQMKRGQRSQ